MNSEKLSTDQKVELFLQYFKGRKDVYAVRWENKQGKGGYSVACDNKWKSGVCYKPKIKCNECQHRKLSTLNQDVIYDHLTGKHTIGMYPLLTNDHCCFLAVFFKTQALRFSANGIPRFICTAYFDQGYLSLPRGCIDDVAKLLKEHSIEYVVDDKRFSGRVLKNAAFKGRLRKDQKKAVLALNAHDTGILHAPTAFGKTITAIGMIIERKVNTLILVHSRQLLDQWKERLLLFLEGVKIGTIGGGRRKSLGQVDVATYQSLIKRTNNSVDEILFDYGQVIVDECHHISAPRYESLVSEIRAKFVLGMTATLQRRDGHQPIIFMQAGPISYQVKDNTDKRFERRVIVKQIDSSPPVNLCQSDKRIQISDVYRWLMNDEERNKRIVIRINQNQ